MDGDVVEELTHNLTSKLRNKTNYQVVGELLRNNNHIAKQLNKYLNNSTTSQIKIEEFDPKKQASM